MNAGGSGDGTVEDKAGLQPGEDIRPCMGIEEAKALASSLYGLTRVNVRQLNSYDDKNFFLQVPDEVKTESTWEHGYVLKILNALDSRNAEFVEAQNEMMIFLDSKGIVCTQPVKNMNGQYYSIERINNKNIKDSQEGKLHVVRLLTYQPAEILYNVPCSPTLLYNIGCYIANLDNLLRDFQHPGLQNRKTVWMLESIPQLKKFTFAIKDTQKQALATEVINAFENNVVPFIPTLERGLIHGDFNEQNILVNKSSTDNGWYVHGVIDLGDINITCYVFELAITICYMMLQTKVLPLEAPGHVIAGYITKRKLPEIEFQLLQKCVSARICQSLVLGAYTHMHDPTNQYLLTTTERGWELLKQLWSISEENLYKTWNNVIQSYS